MIEALCYTLLGWIIGLSAGLFAGYTLASKAMDKLLNDLIRLYDELSKHKLKEGET